MIAYFERFEIKMTLKQAQSVSHQGECLPDILELLKNKEYLRQLKNIDPESIAAELKEYGAWSDEELLNFPENNLKLITWIAGCNIVEELSMKNSRR